MAQTTQHRHVDFLTGRSLPPLSAIALGCVVALVKWEERYRSRRALARLDDHLRKDIGLTRSEVRRELDRQFWQR